jgi:glycosyltransferase involved in cell wall biosynthesis
VHLLSGDLWAGAEVQAFHLLVALKGRGRYEPHALLFNEGMLAAKLRQEEIPVSVLPEKGIGTIRLARGAGRALSETRPVLVHSHGYKEDWVASLSTRGGRTVPLLRTQHGSPFPGGRFPYTLYYALDRFLARRFFRRTIAVSDAIGREVARFLPEHLIARVPSGIPFGSAEGTVEAEFAFPGGTRVVASMGRLSREKRFDRLIDAIGEVRRRFPEARLLLIGEGPERPVLEKRAAERAPGGVIFTGFRSDSTRLVARAELFVLSSEREGLPISLLEAMALGVPVVAPAVGGIPELVRSGESGLLAEEGSASALAPLIERLLGDPELRARLGASARETVRRRHDVSRTAASTEQVYAEVLAER